ncbi:MAG TPA: metalloregulator ArsR/SmtB family transcription factor [Gammaproteobacteria bacterium]|nr:metalloregulator ArsR/SmtB family transcription factor [Gammaproteobacteria bacterium]
MSSQLKQDLFAQFARIGKALANANRLELLELLAQGERSVEALARVSGLSVANTSQHLQQLRRAGLVQARKRGLKVFYRPGGDDVLELFNALRRVGERHLAEVPRLVETHLHIRDELEAVARDELLERIRAGTVTVIDVRPPEEYAAGHVPGALNLPLAELEQRLEALEPGREIVAYCRGPHCVLAYEAVARLRRQGRAARRLEDGMPEWRLAGLPVETESAGQD